MDHDLFVLETTNNSTAASSYFTGFELSSFIATICVSFVSELVSIFVNPWYVLLINCYSLGKRSLVQVFCPAYLFDPSIALP